ncbi:hypothetical protein [Endozoicomonas numazuensis]|uniref:ATPase AAA-type core domain-containing protein n=1 Tax=Endozoicomonas numazuensis TaxID=1137799 RepID=A0A081N9B4_9GAMM|nr:hypothetical protein [Endozoicomonas numazuensis]KEQ15037.1 hypothetical protein GZ78_24465 [Endozoicomonas numazuensis]
MISLLHQRVLDGCQFIIATHSPILLSYPNAVIYEVRDNGLEPVEYEDTDTYAVTRRFLNNYSAMLEILMEE